MLSLLTYVAPSLTCHPSFPLPAALTQQCLKVWGSGERRSLNALSPGVSALSLLSLALLAPPAELSRCVQSWPGPCPWGPQQPPMDRSRLSRFPSASDAVSAELFMPATPGPGVCPGIVSHPVAVHSTSTGWHLTSAEIEAGRALESHREQCRQDSRLPKYHPHSPHVLVLLSLRPERWNRTSFWKLCSDLSPLFPSFPQYPGEARTGLAHCSSALCLPSSLTASLLA